MYRIKRINFIIILLLLTIFLRFANAESLQMEYNSDDYIFDDYNFLSLIGFKSNKLSLNDNFIEKFAG